MPILLRRLSSPEISSVDGQHPMTHAGEDVPMTEDPGGQLGKTPWTPEVCKVQNHHPSVLNGQRSLKNLFHFEFNENIC